MFATLAIVAALAAEPTPILIVTVHGPSQQAQVVRNETVAQARADHAARMSAAAEATRLRSELLAAVREHAKPERLASDTELLRAITPVAASTEAAPMVVAAKEDAALAGASK